MHGHDVPSYFYSTKMAAVIMLVLAQINLTIFYWCPVVELITHRSQGSRKECGQTDVLPVNHFHEWAQQKNNTDKQ